MKISARTNNDFKGSYYGYHDEMDWKETPLYLKLLFAFMIIIMLGGVGIIFYFFSTSNVEWAVKTILLLIAAVFFLIHLFVVLFDIAKYGKARKQAKILGSIFTAVGVLILVGMILSEFAHFAIVISIGTVLIFISIGIGLWIAGEKKLKRMKTECTQPVMATCIGFETLNPHMPILNEKDATFAQNEVVARVEVSKPIWEFEYLGEKYRAVPEEYQGSHKVIEGQEYKIYINPKNPQDIYSEDSSDAKYLVRMGKIWIIFTMLMIALLVGTFYILYATGNLYF